ncbi:DEAD/DEAH box helicase family protein [candidate division KSB1 bacterium]
MTPKTKSIIKNQPYYFEHKRQINKIIRDYQNSYTQKDLFSESSDISIFNALESGITKHKLRYYQLEALFVLDGIYSLSQAEKYQAKRPGYTKNKMVTDLLEVIDKESNFSAPFLGFEMATGSGKTMLMGASMYLLNKKYGVKSFLIIAPSSLDIYQKTIRNFTIGGIDSIWTDEATFNFNLITGDNYTEKLLINYNTDANIFVFNIDKFGAKAVNTEKAWESSEWKDESGNTISIREFLSSQKLVIITDEAHHTQGQKSMNIIKKFQPEAVLEYTATAVENSRDEEKRSQQIVYKYDIRRFLEDGHGKIVRAVALAVESDGRKKQKEVADSERLKIITLLLIHLVKKHGVLLDPKARGTKPVAFIKVKNDTEYTQGVFDYIQNGLVNDIDNLNIILEKAASQDIEITSLITNLIKEQFNNDVDRIRESIHHVCKNAIFYHGRSDQMTAKQFLDIRKNEVELVVYMEKLDEGIDLPNIYTMAVINDTVSDFKTSVKQIIGRGVRLTKEKREFDEEKIDMLKTQSEKLHVVCDQGKNFEDVITAIQNEFGLSDKYLSLDKPKRAIINEAKSDRLDQRYLPQIRADFKAREGVKLMELVRDTETIINQYLEYNCFAGSEDEDTTKKYLKYLPESFFVEVDVFADKKIFHAQMRNVGASFEPLTLVEKQTKAIYGIVQKNLYCLPDTKRVYSVFEDYISKLNSIGLLFYKLDEADRQLALNHVVHNFAFFYRNHIEKNFYELDFKPIRTEDSWNLKQQFGDYQIKIPEDQIQSDTLLKTKDKEKLIDFIKSQYHFFGYKNSIFDYIKFDTYTEKQFADYAETIINNSEITEKPFWVRNERQIYFTYGSHRYYPDFIMFHDGMFYVIETKGEIFSDTRKNVLLAELDNHDGYKGVLVFSDAMDEIDESTPFGAFLEIAKASVKRYQSKAILEKLPKEEDQFVKYIPAYQPQKAFKRIIKNQKAAIDGWYEVEERPGGYPETCFAVQIKGNALLPRFRNNDWIIMDSNYELKDCINKLVLIHHESIIDEYPENLTIRKLGITSKQVQTGLFESTINTLILKSIQDEDIIIEDVTDDSINIVGRIYE